MSDPGPLPPPPRRPRWLWILLGIVGLCLLICIGLFAWANTIGRPFLDEFVATFEAVQTATAEAGNPVLDPTPVLGTPIAD